MFTWTNNQTPLVIKKLDRVLMTRSWEDLFPEVMVRKLAREVSVHNSLGCVWI
jgi:hypothetical protein